MPPMPVAGIPIVPRSIIVLIMCPILLGSTNDVLRRRGARGRGTMSLGRMIRPPAPFGKRQKTSAHTLRQIVNVDRVCVGLEWLPSGCSGGTGVPPVFLVQRPAGRRSHPHSNATPVREPLSVGLIETCSQ